MTNDDRLAAVRRLGAVVEPLAAAVYFSAEAQKNYEALGLNYFEGYFCSRSATLGAAPWRVVCGAFAAFKPQVVEHAVTQGWAKTTPDELLAARLDGAREQMASRIDALADELVTALQAVFAIDDWALVERYIQGAEVNVGILDGRVIAKLIRRLEAGLNPDVELPAHLRSSGFERVPGVAASGCLSRPGTTLH